VWPSVPLSPNCVALTQLRRLRRCAVRHSVTCNSREEIPPTVKEQGRGAVRSGFVRLRFDDFGLHADRVNRNQGAEATLSFLLASCEMRAAHRTERHSAPALALQLTT